MPGTSVLTIGNFDGVHRGHAALVHRARDLAAARAARVVVMAFDPHPLGLISPGPGSPARLTTFERRAQFLRAEGADHVERIIPTPELLGLAPESFIRSVAEKFNAVAMVEGDDFRFGKDRAGDAAMLRTLGKSLNFEVSVVDPVLIDLDDQSLVRASSSIIRWLVSHGRMPDAARVLGRPYELTGTVIKGDQRGRTIGFPTANLGELGDLLLPADGVYAAIAHLPGNRSRPAAVHIGPRATFDSAPRTVEAHIPGWPGPLAEGAPEYNWPLRLSMLAYLRDQAKFDSVPALVEQIQRDTDRAVEMAQRHLRSYHPSQSSGGEGEGGGFERRSTNQQTPIKPTTTAPQSCTTTA